ncbi:hypothetical protein AWB92_11390 [Mycobacterium sp. IEC1808]|nr:hypothetical protein AWB92_11390 [Mycobacterium sp. IEC1808]
MWWLLIAGLTNRLQRLGRVTTRYEQDGQPRWWLDGSVQHPWTSDDVECADSSMYNGQEPRLRMDGRDGSA